MVSMERNFGRIGRMKDSSTTLDSYGSLLSNAPSLAIIRAVLAMIQHETSASKTKNRYSSNCYWLYNVMYIAKKGYRYSSYCLYGSVDLNVQTAKIFLLADLSCCIIASTARMIASDGALESRGP